MFYSKLNRFLPAALSNNVILNAGNAWLTIFLLLLFLLFLQNVYVVVHEVVCSRVAPVTCRPPRISATLSEVLFFIAFPPQG